MENYQRCLERVQAGDAEGLKRILEEDPGCADTRDANGVSLPMQALYRGRRDLAEMIASSKRTLDIFETASLGRLDRLQQLASDHRAVEARSADGFTALHFACFFGQPEAARLLIEAGAAVDAIAANPTRVMPLHSAASARNLEAARLLLAHGAPPNVRQQGGWAPIHAAAQNGDRSMVELLLSHGADASQANDEGKTPAMVASEKGLVGIVALLEE